MNIGNRLKKVTTKLKQNNTLSREALEVIWKNRNKRKLPRGDSLTAVTLRRQVRESTIPTPAKIVLKKGLTEVIQKHLKRGKMWVDFREDVTAFEKKRGKPLSKKELEQAWHKWNSDHANC